MHSSRGKSKKEKKEDMCGDTNEMNTGLFRYCRVLVVGVVSCGWFVFHLPLVSFVRTMASRIYSSP
jgi:hypothetical protein